MHTIRCFAVAMATTALVACSNDDSNGGTNAGDAATFDGSLADGGLLDGSASDAADGAVALSDGQIAGAVTAVNTAEIQQGQLAQTKASSSAVIAFAGQMVTDHTKANDDLAALEQTAAITAETSKLQDQLQAAAQQTLTSLQPLTGSAFDNAYIQAQVDAHTQVLLLLDQSLIPSAQNAQLKSFLQTTRATVATHLQMAQMLAGQLGDGGTDGAADGGTDALSAGD